MDEEAHPLINTTKKKKEEEEEPEKTFFEKYVQTCLAEFIGTALFVFVGTMSAQNQMLLGVAIAHGLCMTLLIYGLGGISGGHFNPAVTLAIALCNGVQWALVPAYILCQLLGGVLGAAFTRGCLSFTGNITGVVDTGNITTTVYYKMMGGATTLHANANYDTSAGTGVLTEAVLTYLLVTTILLTAVDPKTRSSMNGLAIGLAITVSIVAGGAITGASMNPARSLGPSLVISDLRTDVWRDHYIYWFGPLIGAGMATAFYRLLLSERGSRVVKV